MTLERFDPDVLPEAVGLAWCERDRVGARVAWEHQSEILVRHGVAAADVARFAQMVFAYIDELSGASVAGHRDEIEIGRAHV